MPDGRMAPQRAWFLAGLFLTTLATLALEILDTRLLSVLTWYHLSFFAVSVAMFGMAAGAVHVYLGGARFEGDAAPRALARFGTAFALAIAVSHVANLCIPIPAEPSLGAVVSLGLATVVLAVPFYVSGLLVSIALTRVPGPIGLVYAIDLLGASLGSLLILPLLSIGDITSTAFACAAIAALGGICFRRFAGRGGALGDACLAGALVLLAVANSATPHGLRVIYPKGKPLPSAGIAYEFWSLHGQVIAWQPAVGAPFFWGPGLGAEGYRVERVAMVIDGSAGTTMTRWDGALDSLAWVRHDVTSLPYHIRPGGDAAVIGIGGGRDVLTALWAGSRSVVGIEINRAFIELLEGPLRDFANLATHPDVRLVHDEARSYLTRTDERYDVLQMSLIDTWAATGAGAFTLSENGLYTVEAWQVFLRTLKPGGILAVSRWYAPQRASETSRLVALATAALLESGVAEPAAHIALVAFARRTPRGPGKGVATLLVSNRPLRAKDLRTIDDVSRRFGFDVLLVPGRPAAQPLLGRIAASRSRAEVLEVVAPEPFDYTPPTDAKPYFFNLVRPSSLFTPPAALASGGVVAGNMVATLALAALLGIVALLVVGVILGPLVRAGLPRLDRVGFAAAVLWFALIGAGFMLIQIGFMQRFSIYLGHPTYAIAVILFSMILATGLGSLLSDRLPVEAAPTWPRRLALATAAAVVLATLAIPPVLEATIQGGLAVRCLVVIGLVAPISVLLGTFFPMGMRLVQRLSGDATPWMWGVNGACGVLASVAAVAISMWLGIPTSFWIAAGAYALLAVPATLLWGQGARAAATGGGADA